MPTHHCISWPCPTCNGFATGTATTTSTLWNGGACGVCGALYLGSHVCSVEDLVRRSDELRELARQKFDEAFDRGQSTEFQFDRTAGCRCRPENGGSGVCGCILGGPEVTC